MALNTVLNVSCEFTLGNVSKMVWIFWRTLFYTKDAKNVNSLSKKTEVAITLPVFVEMSFAIFVRRVGEVSTIVLYSIGEHNHNMRKHWDKYNKIYLYQTYNDSFVLEYSTFLPKILGYSKGMNPFFILNKFIPQHKLLIRLHLSQYLTKCAI